MATRVRLDLDPKTFGRLVESAVAEQRPADWQAEVILRRALGTWEEQFVGYRVSDAASPEDKSESAEKEATNAVA